MKFSDFTSFLRERPYTSHFIATGIATEEDFAAAIRDQRLHFTMAPGSIDSILFISSTGRIHLEGSFQSELFDRIQYRENFKNHIGVNGPSTTVAAYLDWSKSFASPARVFKETVYRKKVSAEPAPGAVHALTIEDFEGWHDLYVSYLSEMKINSSATKSERLARFKRETERKMHWGLEHGDELVSIGAFNSLGTKSAQIGGVFTRPDFRRQGASEKVMRRILRDAHNVHALDELILFTGYDDIAPRTLYEKLGFAKVSDYWVAEF